MKNSIATYPILALVLAGTGYAISSASTRNSHDDVASMMNELMGNMPQMMENCQKVIGEETSQEEHFSHHL